MLAYYFLLGAERGESITITWHHPSHAQVAMEMEMEVGLLSGSVLGAGRMIAVVICRRA